MNTIDVLVAKGVKQKAEKLASFTYKINNKKFYFIVAKLENDHPRVVLRRTGRPVIKLSYSKLLSQNNDYAKAGEREIEGLIGRFGHSHVENVLSSNEG